MAKLIAKTAVYLKAGEPKISEIDKRLIRPTPIRYVEPGAEFDVDDKQAAELIAAGGAVAAIVEKPKKG